jgi:hypothetical protein
MINLSCVSIILYLDISIHNMAIMISPAVILRIISVYMNGTEASVSTQQHCRLQNEQKRNQLRRDVLKTDS